MRAVVIGFCKAGAAVLAVKVPSGGENTVGPIERSRGGAR
jgi:hypothetical protein